MLDVLGVVSEWGHNLRLFAYIWMKLNAAPGHVPKRL